MGADSISKINVLKKKMAQSFRRNETAMRDEQFPRVQNHVSNNLKMD